MDWELFKIAFEKQLARWWWLYLLIGFSLPFGLMALGIKPLPSNTDNCFEASSRNDLC